MKKKGAALLAVVIIMTAVLILGVVILQSQVSSFKSLKYINRDMQAYYCAESGVNDLTDKLVNNIKIAANSFNSSSSKQLSDFILEVNGLNNSAAASAKITDGVLNKDSDTWYAANIDSSYQPLPATTTLDSQNRLYFIYPINSTGKANLKDAITHKITKTVSIVVTVTNYTQGGGTGGGVIGEPEKTILTTIDNLIKALIGGNANDIRSWASQLPANWDQIPGVESTLHPIFDQYKNNGWHLFDQDTNVLIHNSNVNQYHNLKILPQVSNDLEKILNNSSNTSISVGAPIISK